MVGTLTSNFGRRGIIRDDGMLDVKYLDEDAVTAQLAQGTIPDVLREQLNLIDENSGIGKEFHEMMVNITQKLLDDAGEKIDIRAQGIRFMLCDEAQPNAGVFTDANPPIITFTTGLFAKIKTLDQLEAIIGHELGHKKLAEKIGTHRNSKGEEVGGDGCGTYLLFNAKRNVEAGKELIDLLSGEQTDIERWVGYIDPHPNDFLRIRILENIYEGIREVYGSYTTASTPLPAELAAFTSVEYTHPFKQELNSIGYDQFTLEEKVDWLIKEIPIAEHWKGYGYRSRYSEFCKMIYDVSNECQAGYAKSWNDTLGAEKYLALKDKLVEATAQSRSGDFYRNADNFQYKPFRTLFDATYSFLKSQDAGTSAQAAAEIMAALKTRKMPLEEDVVLNDMHLPAFELPGREETAAAEKLIMEEFLAAAPGRSDHDRLYEEVCEKHGISVAWNEQLKHYQQTGNPEIAHVIRLLGGLDPRLPKLPERPEVEPTSSAGWVSKEDFVLPILVTRRVGSHASDIGRVQINENGKIVGKYNESERLSYEEYDKEKARLYEEFSIIQEERKQKAAANKTDFGNMETDFWGFVSGNAQLLQPASTLKGVTCRQAFVEEFIDNLTALINKDPEKFKPLAYEFFSGRSYIDHSPILQGNTEGKFTLPIILESNAGRYRKYTSSGIPAGIDMGHPYFQFMRGNPAMFSRDDRLACLQFANYKKKTDEPGDRLHDVIEDELTTLHPEIPTAHDEIFKIADDMLAKLKAAEESGQPPFTMALTLPSDGAPYLYPSALSIIQGRMYEAFFERTTPFGLNDIRSYQARFYGFGYETLGSTSDFQKTIIERNRGYDLSNNISADDLLEKYNYYIENKYFKDRPELRREYQSCILRRKDEISVSPAMQELCHDILQKHKFTSPEFDKIIINHWNKCHTGRITDASSIVAGLIADNVPIVRVNDMLAQLAEQHRLQPEACYAIEQQLLDAGLGQIPQTHFKAVVFEVVIDLIGQDAEVRDQMLEFLSSNATPESVRKTKELINKASVRSLSNSRWNMENGNQKIPEQTKEDMLALMHENYCSWPVHWQALFVEKILFPVNPHLAANSGINVTIESEADRILDKVFPASKENSRIGRDFIECYLKQHTEAGQRLVLAIVMAASREGELDSLENISQMRQAGRTVGRILCKQHPLGAKFAQEIESYTGTDPEFRLGLQDVDVKAGVDLGPRWQTMHLLEEATKDHPEVLRNKEVGSVLGGGSVQINVELEKGLDDDEAIALLRNNVNERAERQYQMFGATLKEFAERNPGFMGLRNILESSYQNLKIETDYSNAPKQSANAERIYNDGAIEADGRMVHFAAVQFRSHAERFKLYSLAKGTHFNDLPVGTEEERAIKKAAAKAIITRELTAMMRGQAIDSDRHGKQQKIIVNDDGSLLVTNFDDGAVAINPPTEQEKKILGRILGKCVEQMLVQDRPISETIMEVTKEYEGTSVGNYVETSKRALRTMFGDYMNAAYTDAAGERKTLLENKDVKDIASAVLRAGKLDKNIIYPAAREIGYKSLCMMHRGTVSQAVMNIIGAAGNFVKRLFGSKKDKPAISVKDPGKYLDRILESKDGKAADWKDKLHEKALDAAAKSAGNIIS